MKITIDLPDQKIIDAIDAADIGYWARVTQSADTKAMLDGKDFAVIEDIENEDATEDYRLTSGKIRTAISIIASKWPRHLRSILADDADAETGDVLIQVALFGDIIYG